MPETSQPTLRRGAPGAHRAPASAPTGQRGDIQGMRAVAVLLVMLSHASVAGFSGGFVGVDVFFVISGFLITGILVREVGTTGRVSIAGFYARRARRILPAATVTLLAVVLVSSLTYTAARLEEVRDHVTWAAFFAANLWSAKSGSDYFSEGGFVSPVQHYWSLAVEEQFYLVWPALIAVILLVLGRRTHERGRWMAIAIGTLSLVSLCWSVRQTGSDPVPAYYSTLTRGWELGVGALLALAHGPVSRVPGMVKAVASWVGLGAIAVSAVTYSSATPFPSGYALLPVLGSALVLGGGIQAGGAQRRAGSGSLSGSVTGAGRLLDLAPMRWIGDISYSLYLWHWPFLLLPAAYLARDLTMLERVTALVAAAAAAWLSYRFVETPLRRARPSRAQRGVAERGVVGRGVAGRGDGGPRTSHRGSGRTGERARSLALWPVAILLVVGAVAASSLTTAHPGLAADAAGSARSAGSAGAAGPDDPQAAVAAAVVRAGAGEPVPARLQPSLDDLFDDVSRLPTGCGAERDDTKVTSCVLGDPSATRTLVLFGDSHVIMWRRPIEELAKAHGWRIVAFQKASCFPLDATLWRAEKDRAYTECDTWRADAYRQMRAIKPDLIITSGLVNLSIVDPRTGLVAASDARALELFTAGVRSNLVELAKIAPRVTVIGGTQILAKTASDCLGSRAATLATCVRAPLPGVVARNTVWQRAAAAAGATWIDPMPWMCSGQLCPIVIGDTVVYRDADHITTTFAASLKDELQARLRL